MTNSATRAREILDELSRTPVPTGPVELSQAYLRAVERVEKLPVNRARADKTWVIRIVRESAELFARAVRKR